MPLVRRTLQPLSIRVPQRRRVHRSVQRVRRRAAVRRRQRRGAGAGLPGGGGAPRASCPPTRARRLGARARRRAARIGNHQLLSPLKVHLSRLSIQCIAF